MSNTIQYKKVTAISISEKELNEYGADGWDNYAIVNNNFYFKRQRGEVKPIYQANANGLSNAAKGKR